MEVGFLVGRDADMDAGLFDGWMENFSVRKRCKGSVASEGS